MARKVFLDVGAHNGETVREVLDPKYEFDLVVAFEPSSRCLIQPHPKLKIVQAALSDHAGRETLYATGTQGASLFGDKLDLETDELEDVEVIRASDWFEAHLEVWDVVYMKLNCQGSEVHILDDLIRSRRLALCSRIVVDFDVAKIPSQAHLEDRAWRDLQEFAHETNNVVDLARDVLIGETHRDRVRHWLELCEPRVKWLLPSLALDFKWVSATYGSHEIKADVLSDLIENLGTRRGRVDVNNALCGCDPHVGWGKTLHIEYEGGELRKTATATEGCALFVTDNHETCVSFMIRCHNAQETLKKAMETLTHLLRYGLRYEIVVILHRCTDDSERIADDYAQTAPIPVRVLTYDLQVSRSGLETYVTDDDHPCSFVHYSNWCLQQTRAPFVFKWDSDFEMNDVVAKKVAQVVAENDGRPVKVTIPTKFKDGARGAAEPWLSNAIVRYAKYVLWEVPDFPQGTLTIALQHWFLHNDSPKSAPKSYWRPDPWFANEVQGLGYVFKQRFKAVQEMLGDRQVPRDVARSCSTNLDNGVYYRLKNMTITDIDRLWVECTVVVFACDDAARLRKTLETFVDMNTATVKNLIVVEDSGLRGVNDFAQDVCPFPVTLLYNRVPIGKLRSFDRAYDLVRTEFVMHIEPGTVFRIPSFVEQSAPLLFTDPKVLSVWLEGDAKAAKPHFEERKSLFFTTGLRLTRTARFHGLLSQLGSTELECDRKFAESGHVAKVI
jgi:FkbM family methyltransferase